MIQIETIDVDRCSFCLITGHFDTIFPLPRCTVPSIAAPALATGVFFYLSHNTYYLCGPLPIPLPVARYWRTHGVRHHDMRQCAVVGAAVVFQPCSVVRVLMEVLRAYVVVLARNSENITVLKPDRCCHAVDRQGLKAPKSSPNTTKPVHFFLFYINNLLQYATHAKTA